MLSDIPSPIDLRPMRDAREWEETAMSKRPWRTEFFEAFASEVRSMGPSVQRILELGSGPGFLAEHLLLRAVPSVEYVALDFSPAMHELAAQRLGPLGSRVHVVTDRRNGATDVRRNGASNRWVKRRPEGVKTGSILQPFEGWI